MQNICIVTDSTADLPENLVSEYGITVVPLKVIFGENEMLRDGVDIGPAEFAAVYEELATRAGSIVSVHISSELSGTVQSARLAAGMVSGADIEVVDSRLVSMGLGLIVLESAKAAWDGKTKAEIVFLIENMIEKIQLFFVVNTLEYLARGGRIGKAQAFLGSLLNIRLICCLKEGIIHPYEKVRGKARAIERLVEITAGKMGGQPVLCSLVHGMDPVGLEQLRLKVMDKLNLAGDPILSELGAVVGTHAGPGVLGVMCYPCR